MYTHALQRGRYRVQSPANKLLSDAALREVAYGTLNVRYSVLVESNGKQVQ